MEPWDWAEFLPLQDRERQRHKRARLRQWTILKEPRTWVTALVVADVSLVFLLGFRTGAVLGAMALLPLLLTPLLAVLIYWLVWSEFHR
jgi:hypothetical protein